MLCRTLGNGRWRHADEMLEDLTADEFEDWHALYQLDPWGEDRADARAARQAWASLQPHSRKKLDESKYRLQFKGPPPTPEQYRAKSMRAYAMQGGFRP